MTSHIIYLNKSTHLEEAPKLNQAKNACHRENEEPGTSGESPSIILMVAIVLNWEEDATSDSAVIGDIFKPS